VRDGVFARIAAGLPGLTIKVNELFEAGENKVVMLGYYDGVFKTIGKPIHAQVAHVWTLAGGKVIRFQQYADTYQLTEFAK
jgi:ketosteroid isomerase-like protein